MRVPSTHVRFLWTLTLLSALAAPVAAEDDSGWIGLTTSGLDAWKGSTGDWKVVGDAHLKPDDPKHLEGEAGSGAIINDPPGRTTNLVSKKAFGDVEVHLEFMVPKGSNSGIKFEGLYEVQIYDSYGKDKVTASDCGGIYPRAELLPRYHHIDDGYPPRSNACKPPGEWQTLDVIFRAPKFDENGKKIANATFEKVVLNGEVLHDNLSVPTPTGHAYTQKEIPTGPILLQADHGPVAFRNVRARPLP